MADAGPGPVALAGAAGADDGAPPAAAEPKDIKSALQTIFNRMVEVKVVTIVEAVDLDISITNGRSSASLQPFGKKVDALVTIFNLIDGDVINIIPPNLRDDAALRDYHSSQVDKSMAVLPANIAAVVDLGKAILREFS
jgi:hypothetical protein